MHIHALTGLVSVLFAVSGTATVAEAANPSASATPSVRDAATVVTELELLSRLGDHPAVLAGSAELPLARAELLASRRLENPSLEFRSEDPGGVTSQVEWLLSWQLPGPARGLGIEAAQKSVDAAAARVDQHLRTLRSRVRKDYADWAIASARLEMLAAFLARLDTLAGRERVRVEKGESSGLEARRLGLVVAALEVRHSLALAEERRTRGAIRRWWPDLPLDARPQIPTAFRLADPSARGSEAAAQAGGEHPLIAASRAQAEAAELARRASERFLEAPALTAGWQQLEAPGGDLSGPVLGVAWRLPLFDRRQAERQAAEARAAAARAEVEITRREIASTREAARERYETLVRKLESAETGLSPSAEMLVAAETSFRYGELALTDLLEIQRSVSDAQLAWLDLVAAALEAHRDLEALTPTAVKFEKLPNTTEKDP
ncbi:MAG: TolC family protein [Acidobacteriota bacterium]